MAIPSRHAPRAVDRYRLYFELVAANYPQPVTIDPAPLSPETFACRFRDAVRGVLVYGSAPDLEPDMRRWARDYVVASVKDSAHLVIGPKEVVKKFNGSAMTHVGSVIDASLPMIDTVQTPSAKILAAIVTLMEAHILPHATITGVTTQAAEAAVAGCERPIEVINHNGTITLL